MKLMRAPLVIIGLLLTLIGLGNFYTGRTKTAEYEQLLARRSAEIDPERRRGPTRLDPHLRSTLLKSLAGEEDPLAAARAKLDFYRVVDSGGRIFVLLGLFCAAIGVIHFWYREMRATPLFAGSK